MKQTTRIIVWLAAFSGINTIGLCAEPFARGPYLGQTPPGSTAQVFAPGLICDMRPHQWETWPSFSADGNTFCFFRRYYVYLTENTDKGWTVPKRIKSIPYKTAYCYLSADANSIYFISSYDLDYNLCRSQRTSDGWSTPQELGPPLSSPARELGLSLAANNNLYFGSARKGGPIKFNLWMAPFLGNTWPRADLISLNPPGRDPGIAPDESFMVFTSINRPGGYGQRDLYLTLRRPDGTWSKSRNMGPRINSAYFEYGPRISPDKKYLFFTRANGWWENSSRDTSDIYWVELKEHLPESHR